MNLNKKFLILITLLFSSLLIINFVNLTRIEVWQRDPSNNFNIKNLRLSADPISYDDVLLNTTEIRRYMDTINITLKNIDKFEDPSNLYAFINVSFTNGTMVNYSMTIPSDAKHSYWCFIPPINATPGLQNVTFQVFNSSWDLLNDQTTKTNFTILNNLPYCSAYLDTTKIYRNEFLSVNLTPSDIEDPLWKLNWTIAILDDGDNEVKSIGLNLLDFVQEINDIFTDVDSYYRIKINITDSDNNHSVHYFPFEVINTPPEIIIDTIFFTPEDRTVKRSTDQVKITLNVTDIDDEDPINIDVTLNIEDTNGVEEELDFTNNEDGTFDLEFDIEPSKPLGWYDLTIIAKDNNGGIDERSEYLIVQNNPPEIFGYWINNMSTENDISIRYGFDLVFTFNVSDIEDIEGLAFVRVCLLNSENKWYNVSKRYHENESITIRTVDLIEGRWFVYIFIIDSDGTEVGLDIELDDAPQEIEIIPDVSPIITLIFIIVAVCIGFGFGYLITSIFKGRKIKDVSKPKEAAKIEKKKPREKKKDEKLIKEKTDELEEVKEISEGEEKPKPKSKLKIKRKIR